MTILILCACLIKFCYGFVSWVNIFTFVNEFWSLYDIYYDQKDCNMQNYAKVFSGKIVFKFFQKKKPEKNFSLDN